MVTLLLLLSLFTFQPCPSEDSNMCYWNGETMGNQTGKSFIAISDDLVIWL